MTTREDFEAWVKARDLQYPSKEFENAAWAAWQAANAIATNMALRDYFAARAMAAYLIAAQGNTPEPEHTANAAYFMADAMMKAREK